MIEGSVFSVRIGLPGSGKTLGMVEEDLLPHLLAGEQVYTNIWINYIGDNLHYFTADDFDELAPNLRNCVLVMDEIGQILEPRAWENESGNVRRFFQLHRHHHVDIYGSTQDISLVAKSAWIVVDEWILCHKFSRTWLDRFIDWVNSYETFRIGYQEMTYQELKKLSYGWELDNGEENTKDKVGGNIRVKRYKIDNLIHRELNDKKAELWHNYCLKCASRQGSLLPKELKGEFPKEYCPKHIQEELIVKESGIYDTDFDIPIKEKPITFVALIDSPKGYRKIPYKGALTNKQLNDKKALQEQMD